MLPAELALNEAFRHVPASLISLEELVEAFTSPEQASSSTMQSPAELESIVAPVHWAEVTLISPLLWVSKESMPHVMAPILISPLLEVVMLKSPHARDGASISPLLDAFKVTGFEVFNPFAKVMSEELEVENEVTSGANTRTSHLYLPLIEVLLLKPRRRVCPMPGCRPHRPMKKT